MTDYSGDTLEYGYIISGESTQVVIRDPLLDQQWDGYLSYDYRIRPDWSEDGDATFYYDQAGANLSYGYDIIGKYVPPVLIDGDKLNYGYNLLGYYVSTPGSAITAGKIARVKWSDIGSFDFTVGRSNVAGDMPLDHDGFIYQIAQLGDQIIVYTSGGITILTPAKHGGYGKLKGSDIGLIEPWSWAGNEKVHFFINMNFELCKLTSKGLEELGYQSIMEGLYDDDVVVITLDKLQSSVFICNGVDGYIYSVEDNALTKGPPTITGSEPAFPVPGYVIVTSAEAITVPDFGIKTEIIDFGTRKFKTIHRVELGMYSSDTYDVTSTGLRVRIHARAHQAYDTSLNATPWFPVDQDGVATARAFGREFQVELGSMSNDDEFVIDWIKIHGVVHDYNTLDS